jgi:PAS domain S-box-containing protein
VSNEELLAENAELQRRLEEAEETIRAIQSGAVDAFVVQQGAAQRIYTLEGADRPYRLLVEEMQQGAATLLPDSTIVYSNRRLAELLKTSHHTLIGSELRDFIATNLAAFDMLLRECRDGSGKVEAELRCADGERVPVHLTCNALPEECGASIGILVTDLTSQRHQEHLKLLVEELNHRVKNTLASVQSIAQQTLRKTRNTEQFVASFSGRIQALARVHTMLSQMTWQGADLRALIHDQVLLGPIDETRLTAWGPTVMLDPQLALHLAMVVHELGTNSCKYGALSSPTGWVTASWTVDGRQLRLSWVERGGPAVTAPKRQGFGTAFIEQSVKSHQGDAKMLSEAEGVTWTISLPLGQAAAGATSSILPMKMEGSSSHAIADNDRDTSLKGKRVLVVEDEPLVAMDVVGILEQAAIQAVGPATTAADALRLIENETLDAALVDANLRGKPVDEVAAALTRRNVPFAFVTGYDRASLPQAFQSAAMVSKPFTAASVLGVIGRISVQRKGQVIGIRGRTD